jgi:hypothetical protein
VQINFSLRTGGLELEDDLIRGEAGADCQQENYSAEEDQFPGFRFHNFLPANPA